MKFKILLLLLTINFTTPANAQIKYGSNNGKYLTIKGTKIYYEEYGKGTPLLMLHGAFGGIAHFEKVIPILAKKYRVIVSDAPGLGRSDYPENKLSYNVLAQYQSEIINTLKLDSLYVLGWSDGAVTGLILAKNRPDKVKKLIISGANYKANAAKNLEELKNWTDTAWIEKNWSNWVMQYKKTAPLKDWKRYVNEIKDMWFQEQYFPKANLETMQVPTLVVYGDNDMYTLEHGIEIHNAIKNSQFCVIPNCSHSVFEEKPEFISRISIDFLSGK
ncbi:MAG: alpha/beta hydrolase [Flavobacterium sp.]|nr:alpha/beta hydrolase [Flavobacterium sp.]